MWLTPVALLIVIAIAVGWVRLAHGPVSVPFLNKAVADGIASELPGLTASVGDTVVTLTPSGGLEFRLIDLRLLERDGSPVVSAPVAAIGLSDQSYMSLRVVPERVELIEPRLALSYSDAGGLSLRFSAPAVEPSSTAGDARGSLATPVPNQAGDQPALLKQIDLAQLLASYASNARNGTSPTSALKQIGLRNARLTIEQDGRTSELLVPEAAVDLAHHSRKSVISGQARIASDRGDWHISVLAEDSETTGLISIKSSIRDLVPSALGRSVPALALIGALDLPVGADASIEVSTSGEIGSMNVAVELGRGRVDFGTATHAPFLVDAGLVTASYDAAAGRISIAPSTLKWGESHITLTGTMDNRKGEGELSQWSYAIRANDGVLAAEEFGVGPMPIDTFEVRGLLDTAADRIDIEVAKLAVQGGEIQLGGVIALGRDPSARIEARGQGMSSAVLTAIWPRMIAPDTRRWIGQHVEAGRVASSRIAYASGSFAAATGQPLAKSGERISIAVEGQSVATRFFKDTPPVLAPKMLVIMENDALEVTMPEAAMSPSEGKTVAIKSGRLLIGDVLAALPECVVSFRTQAGLGATLEALKSMPFVGLDVSALPADKFDGKLDGQFQITMPLEPDLAPANIKVEGKGRIIDVKSREKIGSLSVQSGTIDLDVTEKAAAATGELIVNGVLAKVEWQRLLDVESEQQPPLRLTARLDNSDRRQLGLELDDHVGGEVPVEVVVGGQGREGIVQVRADLTAAELSIKPLAWRKAGGRAASLAFEIAPGKTQKTELQNFKLEGDDVGIEGWVALGEGNKVVEFFFPDFSLNLVSRLEVQGRRNSSDDWIVTARGASYDAKDFFTSLLSFDGQAATTSKASKSVGLQLDAEIENVLGYADVGLRRFKLRLAQKGGKLTKLDARGTLDGGAPLTAVFSESSGTRKIVAESPDAGQAMRLIGFYSNIRGGEVKLDVDLDAPGAAEKTGTLWVRDFKILGDPVVSEVFSSAPGDGPAIGEATGRRRMVREEFEFDRLKVPFSVGHGQFVMEESYLKGPILGATLRGKLDYGAQRVSLGGTYVPLQGLNNALGGIPVLGDLLSGPRKEGIFGITFAIQGPMAKPQVIVNPLSPLAPGIFRELFQMTAPNPTVQPRGPRTDQGGDDGARASSTDTSARRRKSDGAGEAPVIDGWTSDTVVPSTPTQKR